MLGPGITILRSLQGIKGEISNQHLRKQVCCSKTESFIQQILTQELRHCVRDAASGMDPFMTSPRIYWAPTIWSVSVCLCVHVHVYTNMVCMCTCVFVCMSVILGWQIVSAPYIMHTLQLQDSSFGKQFNTWAPVFMVQELFILAFLKRKYTMNV